MRIGSWFALMFILAGVGFGQSKSTSSAKEIKDCPMHEQQPTGQDHHEQAMKERGEESMGFSQEKTTHRVLLSTNGGVIQVAANSGEDQASVTQIRMHLKHIALAFQAGEFSIPMFVHDQTPPGVPTMERLKTQITYEYKETPNGGRVLIRSRNADAVSAIQAFLRFQIKEHKTGDPLEVP